MKKKIVILLMLTALFSTPIYAQLDSNTKAKLYYTEAEKTYKQGDFENSLKYVIKTEETLGTVVARTLALKTKIQYNLGNFIEAKKLIDAYTADYMAGATQELNDEILAMYISIEEAAEMESARSGSFTDARDGQTYQTIKIGNQVWMAENLNYKTSSGSWCYDNSSSNCGKYGRLYTWESAKRVCPTGWHLPSDREWSVLTDYLGDENVAGTKMKSTTGWKDDGNGANESGFSGLPGGNRNYYGIFSYVGEYGGWWSSTESNTRLARRRSLEYDRGSVGRGSSSKAYGLCVRCLRD
jgi:uncharacterized protein (TIGR02145 family)